MPEGVYSVHCSTASHLYIVSLFIILTAVTTFTLFFLFVYTRWHAQQPPQAPWWKWVMRHRRVLQQRPKAVIRHRHCRWNSTCIDQSAVRKVMRLPLVLPLPLPLLRFKRVIQPLNATDQSTNYNP